MVSNVMQDGDCAHLLLLFVSPDSPVSGHFHAWLKPLFRRDKLTIKMDMVLCQGGCLEEGLPTLLWCLWFWWLSGLLLLPPSPLLQSSTAAEHSACSMLGLCHQEQNQTGKSARNLSMPFCHLWHSLVSLDPLMLLYIIRSVFCILGAHCLANSFVSCHSYWMPSVCSFFNGLFTDKLKVNSVLEQPKEEKEVVKPSVPVAEPESSPNPVVEKPGKKTESARIQQKDKKRWATSFRFPVIC